MGFLNTATEARMMTTRLTVFATEWLRGEWLTQRLVGGLVVEVVEHGSDDEVGHETRVPDAEKQRALRGHQRGCRGEGAPICGHSTRRDRGRSMMPETMAIPPYRLMPLRPVSACRSLQVAARRAEEVTLEVMAQQERRHGKLISVVEPGRRLTMGMSVSQTLQGTCDRRTSTAGAAIAGSPALTTCMNDTEPNLYDNASEDVATMW